MNVRTHISYLRGCGLAFSNLGFSQWKYGMGWYLRTEVSVFAQEIIEGYVYPLEDRTEQLKRTYAYFFIKIVSQVVLAKCPPVPKKRPEKVV